MDQIDGGFNVMENWVTIKGYEGKYEISDLGRVRSLKRTFNWGVNLIPRTIEEKILKLHHHKAGRRTGYYQITFGDRNRFYVHRLVAEAFVPNPNNLPCVNHKDGDGLNNIPSNIEWCSYSENKLHSLNILGCLKAGEIEVLDLQTGIYYASKAEAYRSKPQPFKFSQFACMLAGKWPNKTQYIIT